MNNAEKQIGERKCLDDGAAGRNSWRRSSPDSSTYVHPLRSTTLSLYARYMHAGRMLFRCTAGTSRPGAGRERDSRGVRLLEIMQRQLSRQKSAHAMHS